jgi:hypothetical protein
MDLYILCIPLSFKRFAGEFSSNGNFRQVSAFRTGVKQWFTRWLLRHPFQRAMFSFSLSGITGSRRHKLHLTAAVALPFTFFITEMVLTVMSKGSAAVFQIRPLTASLPFVIYLFMIIGFRSVVLHPVNEDANWVFQAVGQHRTPHYLRGVLKVFYLFGILPMSLILFGFYMYLWGFPQALFHTFFSTVTGCLALELAFFNYHKIPFVSPFVPGKARLKEFWFLYLGGSALFITGFTWLSLEFLKQPLYYLLYLMVVVDILFLLKYLRKRKLASSDLDLVFDEEPEPAMLSLGFD